MQINKCVKIVKVLQNIDKANLLTWPWICNDMFDISISYKYVWYMSYVSWILCNDAELQNRENIDFQVIQRERNDQRCIDG